MGRRWMAVAATAMVTAYVAQVIVPAAETSPAPIAGIAPSYGPKTVSAVPNAAAIVRRIWLPQLDAGYDPQGLAVDDGAIYISAYRSDSLGVRRGPCRVIRIDLETGVSTGHVDVPSPCGHAGGLAVGGDGMLYVADTHTLFATPLARAFDRGARFRQFSLGPGVIGGLAASTPDGIWLGTYEDGPGRLFHFTAATLARLSDGETLEASQAATVLTIPDHAQGAAIGGGGYGSRAAIGTGARSIGSTLLPARRSAVMKSRPVPRASPSAMPADCGRCRRPGLGISTTIPSSVCSANEFTPSRARAREGKAQQICGFWRREDRRRGEKPAFWGVLSAELAQRTRLLCPPAPLTAGRAFFRRRRRADRRDRARRACWRRPRNVTRFRGWAARPPRPTKPNLVYYTRLVAAPARP